MTIQITRPEVEELINERLRSGAFKDAEDVILQALQSSPPQAASAQQSDATDRPRTLKEVFAAVRGSADDIDFSRSPSTGRPVDLS
jgi:Arc/MetJ-type ribon-helix-helix transcriptional regulator